MRFERNVLTLATFIALSVDLLYLIARNAMSDAASPAADIVHGALVLVALTAFAARRITARANTEPNPFRAIGTIVVTGAVLLLLLGALQFSSNIGFDLIDGVMAPRSVATVIAAIVLSSLAMLGAALIFLSISELIFIKRRRNTRRNYIALLVILGLHILVSTAFAHPALYEHPAQWISVLTFIGSLSAMLVNSFRFSWILVLSRREKLVNLLLSFFGFIFFVILAGDITVFGASMESGGLLHHALMWFHPMIWTAVASVCLFGALTMGLGFAGTLLHLPTAKEFDRKKVEITSLRNMSRLVTQVFDFEELVGTSSTLALDVLDGGAAWLELRHPPAGDDPDPIRGTAARQPLPSLSGAPAADSPPLHANGAAVPDHPLPTVVEASLRNISHSVIDRLRIENGTPLRELVFETGKLVVIQDTQADRRVRHAGLHAHGIGSLALAPLLSHDRVIGLLGVAKKNPYEFDKDVLTVLTAFADMTAIAIENNRLISESLRRERFQQELRLAREMQRSLLPPLLTPVSATYDVAATSIPAYEVGGDYYDAVRLDEQRLAFTIGDVSGKGISAALYMAQVKGIFQTMSADGMSTRENLIRMNETLCKSMDRKSFISLIYGVLDVEHGRLRFSRAGHCPLLYISRDSTTFLRPGGMGLGLDSTARFAMSIDEEELDLTPGDLIVLYTDGITEAKDRDGDEYGTDRLASIVEQYRNERVDTIMNAILTAVKRHAPSAEAEDDMTVMVLRWNGAPEYGASTRSKEDMSEAATTDPLRDTRSLAEGAEA